MQRVCRRKKTNRSSSHAMSARIGRCKKTLAKKRSRGAKDVCIRVTRDGPERPKRRETAYASVSKRGAKETEQRGQRDLRARETAYADCQKRGAKMDTCHPTQKCVSRVFSRAFFTQQSVLYTAERSLHSRAFLYSAERAREASELAALCCVIPYMHPCQKRPNRGAKET